jgi:hypothetical protein
MRTVKGFIAVGLDESGDICVGCGKLRRTAIEDLRTSFDSPTVYYAGPISVEVPDEEPLNLINIKLTQ